MRITTAIAVLVLSCFGVLAQETSTGERRVSLNDTAVALDANNAPVLEATLRTTSLTGALDSPVTNIRVVIRNVSPVALAYASGVITFYDSAGVRCGDGLFKADVLAINEAFETDTPGIRIRCAPATWRIVATNLLPRVPPVATPVVPATATPRALNLIISVDGEEHPIQLDKPMVVNVGDTRRTIVVREAP